MEKIHCILIWRIFQLISLRNYFPVLLASVFLNFTRNIAYHIPEMLIFYADKVLVMGHSGNLRVFNFAIQLKS